uniref:Reverse transcriptase/retrotransposon-derived protein RNase H-like domain-containing protein n=1 Tax=Photinus pyralis TaxID=7054 RepID=A0A1Y1MSR2_PHOPY
MQLGTNIPRPKDKKEVQRLLGVFTYVTKFIKKFSCSTEPLRNLLKKDVEFIWLDDQENAFNQLKEALSKKPVLQYFDAKKDTISVDASKSGLGACFLQNKLPCAYASRALTETQCRYAQIEQELLAITFGLTRFHDIIYGTKVTVEMDHLPLITILKKPLHKTPAPALQIQKYDFEIKFIPGKHLLITDTLSRAYVNDNEKDEFKH